MASAAEIPGNLRSQAQASPSISTGSSSPDESGKRRLPVESANGGGGAHQSSSAGSTESGVRQRLVPNASGSSNLGASVNVSWHETASRHSAASLQQQPPIRIPPQPAGQAETLVFPVTQQNQFASAMLAIICVLLAIAVAFLFIQFRTEYRLSQLSKHSPSPFMKLKNSLHGASSQPPKRPNVRYQKPRLPEPEPKEIDIPDPDRYRATKETKEKYPFLKEDPKVAEQQRGVDPEYEAYAQQLQQVLGSLKQAVTKIDESANITEIAGLVKMKPNEKEDKKGELRIEDDHKKFLEDDDEEADAVTRNSGKITEENLMEKLKQAALNYIESQKALSNEEKWLLEKESTAENPETMSEEEAELQFQKIAQYIEKRQKATKKTLLDEIASKEAEIAEEEKILSEEEKWLREYEKTLMENPELMSQEDAEKQLEKIMEYMDRKNTEQTKQLVEDLLQKQEESSSENPMQEESNFPDEPVTNPYDDIMAYRKAHGLRDMKLALELEDKVIDGKGNRETVKIVKELSEAKKERFKLINRLVNYYFETLEPDEREEMREQYTDIISDPDGKANFQSKLHDTLFGGVEEGEALSPYDDGDIDDEDETEAVFDERIGGEISTDAKELLDSIPESEREWIYKRLKAENKIQQDIKDKIDNEILVAKEKSKKNDGTTERKSNEL